jgi:hypothetical protein
LVEKGRFDGQRASDTGDGIACDHLLPKIGKVRVRVREREKERERKGRVFKGRTLSGHRSESELAWAGLLARAHRECEQESGSRLAIATAILSNNKHQQKH